MKRLIGFLVLGGAVATLVVRRFVRRRDEHAAADDRAHTLAALRARLDRIPVAPHRHAY